MEGKLTTIEAGELTQCESVIERGLASFVEVGEALLQIRDSKLYRVKHDTFEAYCQERWNLSRPRAYELINGASATKAVSAVADILPANEKQARPLTRLSTPAAQTAAWEKVVETAPKNSTGEPVITAKHVESVVQDHIAETKPEESRPTPKSSGPTQWDRWGDLNEKARSFFDQLVAERRTNDKSDAVLSLYEALDKAVLAYRKSVTRF